MPLKKKKKKSCRDIQRTSCLSHGLLRTESPDSNSNPTKKGSSLNRCDLPIYIYVLGKSVSVRGASSRDLSKQDLLYIYIRKETGVRFVKDRIYVLYSRSRIQIRIQIRVDTYPYPPYTYDALYVHTAYELPRGCGSHPPPIGPDVCSIHYCIADR